MAVEQIWNVLDIWWTITIGICCANVIMSTTHKENPIKLDQYIMSPDVLLISQWH